MLRSRIPENLILRVKPRGGGDQQPPAQVEDISPDTRIVLGPNAAPICECGWPDQPCDPIARDAERAARRAEGGAR